MKETAKEKFANFVKGENVSKYKVGFILIASIIATILLVVFYINSSKNNVIVGMNDSQKAQVLGAEGAMSGFTEETSTQIGKTVNEAKQEKKPIVINDELDDNNSNVVQEIKEETNKISVNKKENQESNNKKNLEKTSSQNGNESRDSNESTNKTVNSTANAVPNETVNAKEELSKEPEFSMPVNGQILKNFTTENLIYSDTLKEWVTHKGIDIKAEKTSVVKASEKGKVKSIKNDPRYGLTVVIEHTNGYSTVYSNLLTAEFIKVGEQVEKGQTIGTVGDTATFEMADESHIHFEILKDSIQIDPNMYIK